MIHQLLYLFEGVRLVAIVEDDIPYRLCIPPTPTVRRRHTIALERKRDSPERHTSFTDHAEDALDDAHAFVFHEVAVSSGVVSESARSPGAGRNDFALPGLAQPATPCSLRRFRPLELGELVEDAVGELTLRALVSPIVAGTDLRAVLLELASEDVMVGWLPRESVPILCEHHEVPAGGYQVSYPVHARTIQARSALPGVGGGCAGRYRDVRPGPDRSRPA